MRRVGRPVLSAQPSAYLARKQVEADNCLQNDDFDANKIWKNARKTKSILAVLSALKRMMGQHERCVYCHDSHGSDIDHFWPKANYPEKMFVWENMILCCTECGRFKGERFPLEDASPLLIDPSVEDPWHYLDFDTEIGAIVPVFEAHTGEASKKGQATVDLLQLDRREALQSVYLRTWGRIFEAAKNLLDDEGTGADIYDILSNFDDHGLLGWCIVGAGRNIEPFVTIRNTRQNEWVNLVERYHASYDAAN